MYNSHELGIQGEHVATKYLLSQGYKIIERNFYCYFGEIDIIAKDKNEYVFIEVKTRTNSKYGKPVEAITHIKQKHIWKSTEYYLYSKKLKDVFVRIDVIEVYFKDNKFFVHHIKNAINV